MTHGYTGAFDLVAWDVILRETALASVGGGTFTAGALRTRVLNHKFHDPAGLCTLTANQFKLVAGSWLVAASAPAALVDGHQAILRNVTAGGTLVAGSSEYCLPGASVQTRSFIDGPFTVIADQWLEIQHQCQTTASSTGFGIPVSWAGNIYTIVRLKRLA